jgi:hypothetical protein
MLVECTREQPLGGWQVELLDDPQFAATFLALAEFHRVGGLAYESMRPTQANSSVVEVLRVGYDAAVHRHAKVMWALSNLSDTLAEVGCRWAVVKGPVLVERLYDGRPGRRSYLDLDVLVEPASFGDVVAALERSGAVLLDRNWKGMLKTMRGETHFRLVADIPLDLHWNLIDMHRNRMRLDTDELLGRARTEDLRGIAVPTLDVEDSLLHLAFHAAYSGGDRLLWLKDIERSVERWQPDWERVEHRARRAGISRAVGLMLARCRIVMNAQIPAPLAARMTGRGAAAIASVMDRMSPWQYGFGRLAAPSRLLSRSIGHGPTGAARWILSRVVRNMDPWQEVRTSTFTPKGSERDKQRFIDAVNATGRKADP